MLGSVCAKRRVLPGPPQDFNEAVETQKTLGEPVVCRGQRFFVFWSPRAPMSTSASPRHRDLINVGCWGMELTPSNLYPIVVRWYHARHWGYAVTTSRIPTLLP